jgi:hypothetical protein
MLVNLRAESVTDQAVVICRWTGHGWEQVPTEQVGADIYAAKLATLGAVAVIRLDRGVKPTVSSIAKTAGGQGTGAVQPAGAVGVPPGAAGGGPSAGSLALVLGGLVAVLAAGLLLVRRRSARTGSAA